MRVLRVMGKIISRHTFQLPPVPFSRCQESGGVLVQCFLMPIIFSFSQTLNTNASPNGTGNAETYNSFGNTTFDN